MVQRRAIRALVLGLCIGIGGTLFALSPPGGTLEEAAGLSWLFKVRGPIEPPADVVVVAIDKRSSDHLKLPAQPREWPRSLHGRLIEELERRGAALVIFDLKFERPQSAAEDAELATAMGNFGRVLLVEGRDRIEGPVIGSTGQIVDVPLYSTLAEAALGVAPFPLPKVPSRKINQVWAFHADDPTLPLLALHAHDLGVYETWLNILGQAGLAVGGTNSEKSPLHKPVISLDIARNIRSAFKQNPEFAEKVRNATEQAIQISGSTDVRKLALMLGALTRLYDGPDTFYLNFYGPPGTVPTISYYELVSPNAAPQRERAFDVRGKTVFVGVSELSKPTKEEGFRTVFSRSDGVDLSGVEIAATTFANLATGRAVTPADAMMAASILIGVGVIITAGASLLPAGLAVVIALTVAATYAVVAQHLFNADATWLPLATPVGVLIPLAVLLGIASQNAFVRRQRKHMQRAISHYVPGKIVKELADHAVDPVSVKKTVYATCLAADAEGFTALAEGMMPDAAADYLNHFFETLAEPLKRHGADVTQFHADSIMCAWTAPAPDPAVRSKACLAAIEALDAVREFNERHAPLRLGIRFGLHAGRVFVGHAGAEGHFVYGIVGDIANTASRIEQLNKRLGTRLLATEDVVLGLDDTLVRPLGHFSLAGKRSPVSVVEIVSMLGTATMAELSLCSRFAHALEAVRREDWADAAARFEELSKDYPDDGPSRFYLEHCSSLLKPAAASEAPVG